VSAATGPTASRRARAAAGWLVALLVVVLPVTWVALAPAGPAPVATGGAPTGTGVTPGAAGSAAGDVPQLPEPAGEPRSLAVAVDHLPLLVRDLPDEASRRAGADFDASTVRAWRPLTTMVDDALSAIELEAGLPIAAALRAALVDSPATSETPEERAAFDFAARAGGADAAAAGRLVNLAVAVWLQGAASDLDPGDEASTTGFGQYRQVVAGRLLDAVIRAHPDHRAALLDLALLRSTVPSGLWAGEAPARHALDLDPSDVTARLLLASIQARDANAADGADRAVATLEPLLADPATSALGHAAIGDAQLASASIRGREAPRDALRRARLALDAYDAALAEAADPGVYAGRASALRILGRLEDAVAAQRRAIDLAPGALELRAGLARLQEAAGDVDGLRATVADALGALPAWDPPFSTVRLVTTGSDAVMPGDFGFLGYSTGSDADHVVVEISPQGGGYVGIEVVPRTDDPLAGVALQTGMAVDVVLRLALEAAVAEGDVDAVSAVIDAGRRDSPFDTAWLDSWAGAAALNGPSLPVLGDEASFDLAQAEDALRRLGRFADAGRLCADVASATGEPGLEAQAWRCAAESRYHAGDVPGARAAAAHLFEEGGGVDPASALLAGALAEAGGDRVEARRDFGLAAAGELLVGGGDVASVRVLAAVRLSTLDLDEGRGDAAVADADLALATIEANAMTVIGYAYWGLLDYRVNIRGLEQVARNNRAVARLVAAQPGPGRAPVCTPATAPVVDPCAAALADARAAAASDPANAVYRLNIAWAARASGDAATARAALEEAARLDPTLFPAQNDLGVALAEAGDVAGARAAFEGALVASPGYGLAAWNLGVLGLREGPARLPEAQHRLAAAIGADPALRTAPLAFRTDEQTYRFAFDPGQAAVVPAPVGRAYAAGAGALAVAATAGALARLVGALAGGASDALAHEADRRITGARGSRRGRAFRRRLRRSTPARVRAAIPWLVAVAVAVVVIAWAAAADPATLQTTVLVTGWAVLLAVLAHQAGHAVAAAALRGRVLPAHWTPGSIAAIVLVPFGASTGPFPAERFRPARGGTSLLFHAAGPIANGIAAVLALALLIMLPAPAIRVAAQVQLAALAFALVPAKPLDGAPLVRRRPGAVAVAGLVVLGVSTALALGLV
jgi:tetratricopeptide (TPR) repeat protein